MGGGQDGSIRTHTYNQLAQEKPTVITAGKCHGYFYGHGIAHTSAYLLLVDVCRWALISPNLYVLDVQDMRPVI